MIGPALLIGVIVAIACLSADLVRPRRRLDVICSSLTIVAPFPFLFLGVSARPAGGSGGGDRAAGDPARPRRARGSRPAGAVPAGFRRVLAALVITTALLLITVVVLVWYGSTYLLQPADGARSPAARS